MAHDALSVARVYAAALTQIGRETRSLPAIGEDLAAIVKLFDEDAYFRGFFTSPRLDRAVKWKAVSKAFAGKVGRPALGLMKVLVEKGREAVLPDVASEFEKMKDFAENRIHAYVVVAKPLADDLRAAIASRLERASGKSVMLHQRVDPTVLGGAAIRVGDRVIDRTVKTKLAAMKKQLLTSN